MAPKVEARRVSWILSERPYLKSDRIFCEIAEAWASMAVADCASIWFLAKSVASAAKSASSILDRDDSIFCVWLVRLNMVKAKRFCIEPR